MPLDPNTALSLNDFADDISVAQGIINEKIRERDEIIRTLISAGTAGHTELAREARVTRARIYQICASA